MHTSGSKGQTQEIENRGEACGPDGEEAGEGQEDLGRSWASGSQAVAENSRDQAVSQERWRVISRVECRDQVPQTGDCNSRD